MLKLEYKNKVPAIAYRDISNKYFPQQVKFDYRNKYAGCLILGLFTILKTKFRKTFFFLLSNRLMNGRSGTGRADGKYDANEWKEGMYICSFACSIADQFNTVLYYEQVNGNQKSKNKRKKGETDTRGNKYSVHQFPDEIVEFAICELYGCTEKCRWKTSRKDPIHK